MLISRTAFAFQCFSGFDSLDWISNIHPVSQHNNILDAISYYSHLWYYKEIK